MDIIYIIKTTMHFVFICLSISFIVVRESCKFLLKFLIFLNNKYKNKKILFRKSRRVPHSRTAVLSMMKWLDQNKEFPYASRQDILFLAQETKLNERQIRLWLTYDTKLRHEKNLQYN